MNTSLGPPILGKEEYAVAKGYVQSLYLILTNPARLQAPDDTSFYPAFGLLAGFAVELYLKAYLIHRGVSTADLRKGAVAHKLAILAAMCKTKGLSDVKLDWLVRKLGDHHASYEFRYMKPSSEFYPIDLHRLFKAFSRLDRAVDVAIGASASKRLSADDDWIFPPDGAWRFPSQ